MTNQSDRTDRAVKSFNFRKVTVQRTRRGIEARKQKRMDQFTTGMEPVGRPRRILNPISEQTAWLLYEALEEILDESSRATARYSDPLTERGGWVGRGAVLYDTREADRRPCCREDGRCLAHVTGVYEETTTGEVYYYVEDGTHTTANWVHGDDLLSIYSPAGWSVPTSKKPTYLLTRQHGVEDHHDLMTDGGNA